MKQDWYSIEITVPPEAAEALEFAFNSLEADGTATNFTKAGGTDNVTVAGYFTDPPDEERVMDELHYALRAYGFTEDTIVSAVRGAVEDQDWLAEWKKHWRPTAIGNFVIAPPWAEVPDDGKIVIKIEANMAFGTGTHPTTQLCVSAIDRLYKPGQSFLDVGTGTGILAIAAAKLAGRAAFIHGCDTDEDSIEIARENAASNGTNFVTFEVGSISEETQQFDFVCANLTIDVILPILDLLLERSTKTLVLSGILAEQEGAISDALKRREINEFTVERSGEWISVTVIRSGA